MKFLSLLLLFVLTACSGRSLDQQGRTEVPFAEKDRGLLVGDIGSADALMQTASVAYREQRYSAVVANLKTLTSLYPKSALVEPAKVKLIDTYYQTRKFEDLILAAKDYVKSYDDTPAEPYVLTLLAQSYLQNYGGTGRDFTPLLSASKVLKKVIKEHPQSEYYLAAKDSLRDTNKQISASYNNVIDYYRKRGLNEAAEKREDEYRDYMRRYGVLK